MKVLFLTIIYSAIPLILTYCGKYCQKCDPTTSNCTECASNSYYKVSRVWNTNSYACTIITSLANCAVGISETFCQECDPLYRINNGKCEACTSTANCLTCPLGVGICSTCTDNYGIDTSALTCSFTCTATNCFQCKDNDASRCLICDSGYALNILETCSVASVAFCKATSSANICTACEDGYFLRFGKCYKCDVGCEACLANGACTKCSVALGYYMEADQQCYPEKIEYNEVLGE